MQRKWRHRPGDTYTVVTAAPSVVGGEVLVARMSHGTFPNLNQARRWATDMLGHHDYNIVAFRDGRPAAVLWLSEVVEGDPDAVHDFALSAGLPA